MVLRIPFNWAGNKVNYTYFINSMIGRRKYDRVIDMFLGSGNLLLNMRCKANEYIGNDLINLLPKIYNFINDNDLEFHEDDFNEIVDKWGFYSKDDYIKYRDYWNKRNKEDIDKKFICETLIILRLGFNSMVRFNSEGDLNQSFRGIRAGHEGKSVLEGSNFKVSARSLNNVKKVLRKGNYKFYNMDFRDLITELEPFTKDDLLLLDPPYILGNTETYSGEFDEEADIDLLNFVSNVESDFMMFNYLESGGETHNELQKFIKENKLKVYTLSKKCKLSLPTGGNKDVNEVLITNVGV